MSGHRRVCVAAFLLFAGLSVSPACSNPLTDLFNPVPKEETSAAPAASAEECISQPGKSTTPGQHWVYRHDGHRKCWFEAQVTGPVQKHVHHHAAKRLEDNEPVLRKMAALNAQDRLLTPPPAQAPDAPTLNAPDTVLAPGGGTAMLASAAPAPVPPERTFDRLTTDDANANAHVRLAGMLSAVASLDKEATASAQPQAAAASSVPDTDKDRWQLMGTTLVGMVAIALGMVLLMGSLLANRLVNAPQGW